MGETLYQSLGINVWDFRCRVVQFESQVQYNIYSSVVSELNAY